MQLDLLQTFYHAALAKSFTYNALNLSPSAVSRQISQLENQLKCELFYRYPRKLVLTDKGEALFKVAKEIFNHVNAIPEALSGESGEVSGTLRVAIPSGEATYFILDYIKSYLEANPKMRLALISTDEEINFSLDSYDAAFSHFIPNQNNIKHQHLYKFTIKLFASKKYLEQQGTPQTFQDLDQHQVIVHEEYHRLFNYLSWPLTIGLPKGQRREPYLVTSNVLYALTQDLGIGALAAESPDIDRHDLVDVFPKEEGVKIDSYLAYPKHLENTKRLSSFSGFLKKLMTQHLREVSR
jgi:DNA-binding transcriptional LysR family regulator